MGRADQRLLVVSNRLPVTLSSDRGGWTHQRGSGGLVSAFEPVLQERGGMWIGWSGVVDADLAAVQAELDRARGDSPYALRAGAPAAAGAAFGGRDGRTGRTRWPARLRMRA
ncbi:MAG: hypothetical protein EXR95_07395 [Gemmatimonadetes bacterium]|nr:hypothetical protein [Gemmatimonadota bacterium]